MRMYVLMKVKVKIEVVKMEKIIMDIKCVNFKCEKCELNFFVQHDWLKKSSEIESNVKYSWKCPHCGNMAYKNS